MRPVRARPEILWLPSKRMRPVRSGPEILWRLLSKRANEVDANCAGFGGGCLSRERMRSRSGDFVGFQKSE